MLGAAQHGQSSAVIEGATGPAASTVRVGLPTGVGSAMLAKLLTLQTHGVS